MILLANLNQQWLENSILVHKKWKHSLPRKTIEISEYERRISDYISLQCIMNIGLKQKQNYALVLKAYLRLVFCYFEYNRFSYSKSVMNYLLKSSKVSNTA
jgi:hypothetical protein